MALTEEHKAEAAQFAEDPKVGDIACYRAVRDKLYEQMTDRPVAEFSAAMIVHISPVEARDIVAEELIATVQELQRRT